MMLLSIILLNYKKPQLTISCVKSLTHFFHEELKRDLMEIIIVDNNSQDNSADILKKEISDRNMQLLENDENSGFSKGCNIGSKSAKGKYLLFLNNDTVVKDKGILEMINFLERKADAAVIGGQLRNEDGSLQASAGEFYTLFKAIMLLLGLQRLGLLDKSPSNLSEVDWVKGGLLMIKKDIFDSLKGFDENIFMYTEDMELCYRVKSEGYKIYFYPQINVVHKEHGSTSRAFAIKNIYKNLLYFYAKHKSRFEYRVLRTIMLLKGNFLILLGILLGNAYLKNTYREALLAINEKS